MVRGQSMFLYQLLYPPSSRVALTHTRSTKSHKMYTNQMDMIQEIPADMEFFHQNIHEFDSLDYFHQMPTYPPFPTMNVLLQDSGSWAQTYNMHALDPPSLRDGSVYPQALELENSYINEESLYSWSISSSTGSPEAIPVTDISFNAPSIIDLLPYGVVSGAGAWRCVFPGCTSKTRFLRGCDLRKHYKRHRKNLFCRHAGCPKSSSGGFSSRKDLARHEAKHNPDIVCQWKGCSRLFSRRDNMRDHIRRVHQKVRIPDDKCI